jgi:hypothetical protein
MTICRYPPHDWEAALDEFDDEPIETCADPLGVGGTEAVIRHDPSLGNMLIPFFVLFAFAVGAFLAYLI